MSASTRLTRGEAREQTRSRVLAAARNLFVTEGFHRASTDAIAKAAGYSRGALYSSWRTKEDVFFAVLDAEIDERFGLLEPPPRGSIEERLRALARRYADMLEVDPGWSLLMMEFTAHAARHPELGRDLRKRNIALAGRLAEALEQALGYSPIAGRRTAHALMLLQSGTAVEHTASGDELPSGLAEELVVALTSVPWFRGAT